MKRIILLYCLIISFGALAQDKQAVKYSKTITEKDLQSYLSVLASDSLEGRETGQRGQKKAAAYIAGKFKEFGLEPPVDTPDGKSYLQSYPLKKMSYRTAYLKKVEEQKNNFEDFIYFSRSETKGEEYIDVLFLGEISMDQLKSMDLKGKYIAIVESEMADWRKMLASVSDLKAEGIFLFITDTQSYGFMKDRFAGYLKAPRMSLNADNAEGKVFIGDPALAQWMFGKTLDDLTTAGKKETSHLILNADMLVEEIYAENVLGFLKGTEKPDEILVVTAHYDHIGISSNGEINNGADDDGSGSSTVLEIAQAFATAAKKGAGPKRSILFMTVSGEEKGLLGSEYYSEHPVFPLDKTVADLNIDMVGRVDEAHTDHPDYVYLIGSDKLSQELHNISEAANKTYMNLELDYTYNDENDPNRFYYRSDHYNFAKHNVPIIFYFNGTHADYHKPTDTIEKINFEVMRKRGQLVFFTAWDLANRANRIHADPDKIK